MACYIYQLPSWVLDDLCRNMDTLSEWDWMQFGKPVPESLPLLPAIPEAVRPGPEAISGRSSKDEPEKCQPVGPGSSLDTGSAVARAQQQALYPLPFKEDGPCSLKTDFHASLDSKDCSTSVPKQEKFVNLTGDRLSWSEEDVIQATNDFDQSHRISEGTFADIYQGQRHGLAFVFKKLKEAAYSSPGSVDRFLKVEMELCLRCCHPNILPLLGFCTGRFHSLIYPYMANGSLQDRLQAQGGSDLLPWPQRASICSGLLRAVEHLHSLEIIHSNIKSANVLLDQHFTPKLAHPVAHPCPIDRRSKYTMMKTNLFQASAAYLPENFIRVGQLTKQVDIFSCGIVLAEVLTGISAMDRDRSPVYLKDLLLSEIPSSTTSLCSRKTGVENVVVKEICQNHIEKRAGPLPEPCAEAWATAICLCLRRRNASLEERLQGQPSLLPWSRLSEGMGSSSNTPEETDDVDNSSLCVSSLMMLEASARAASCPLPVENRTGLPPTSGGPEADSSSDTCGGRQPLQDATETSWKIEINEAKRKLMENILLYKEDKLDSIELFGS
uniref:Interleukin-1 receptor-associated kinase 2 n=1 Tax=Nannospalax galili TaxID=1026970 RepID=A0A8C6QRL5_NANGA